MLKRYKAFLLALTLLLGFAVATPAEAAVTSLKEGTDAAAVLFDPLAISQVELTHTTGYPTLTYDLLNTDTFQHANIKITLPGKAAVTLTNVGVRLKGQASRGDAKFPMKVKFDAFVPKQYFLGLKRMTLNNMVQDPSFIHEATAYKMYRAAGVPAPRTGYSKVKVEGASLGLYLNIESVDQVFAQRWYPSTAHIYAGPYNCDVVPYNSCYTATIGNTDRTDLYNAGEVSRLHGAEWWTAINQYADMSRIIKLMATDVFMSNWDGYTDAVQNNHFSHFDATGKLTIIPWGLDQTFTTDPSANLTWDGSGPIFRGWSDHRSTLFDHCLEYAPCHSKLIREGVAISALATSIDLAGYKNLVAATINPIVIAPGDIHQADPWQLAIIQGWVDFFIPQRQQVLADFLSSHSAQEIKASIPETLRVGATATATVEKVWEPGVTAKYQWELNDEPIPGATSLTHKITTLEFEQNLTLKVTLQKAGVPDTVVSSNEASIIGRLFKLAPTPKITGVAARGKTLRVSIGTWDSGTIKSIQWLRSGEEIEGATRATYRVGILDFGSQISVRVTGNKLAYVETTRTSRKTIRIR
ncbi:MAG: CotH kinase family protein [Rhodoluna sp.]|nr:CotH kinase family protein [Rhodoluna sp.]